jgi:FkbM family methyltransferase
MLKKLIQFLLQRTLGYQRYLFLFARFNIRELKAGRHEQEFRHFLNLIPEEGAILDIGANIGIITAVLAMNRKRATIHAFEPIPENVEVLERVVRHYQLPNVHISPIALGDKTGSIRMVRPVIRGVKMQGLSHVLPEGQEENVEEGSIFSVPVQRLDDIPELQALPKITAVKMDVENFEYHVLLGGRNLLQRHRPVVYCELWANAVRDQCLELMKELGYTANVMERGQMVPYSGQANINFIFIPSGK